MKKLLTSKVVENFAHCLITSDPVWFNNEQKFVRVVDYLGMLPGAKSKCSVIMHEAEDSKINPDPSKIFKNICTRLLAILRDFLTNT